VHITDTNETENDTNHCNYIMFVARESPVGEAEDHNMIIFTLHKELESGYLFDETTTKLYSRQWQ
jgi:hypothetical protein